MSTNIEELRTMMEHLQSNIAVYCTEETGIKAEKFRKQISRVREQVTTTVRNKGGKIHPYPDEIYRMFFQSSISQYDITAFLTAHAGTGHQFLSEYGKLTMDRLNYVNGDTYGLTPGIHPDYGAPLCIGNIKGWLDQYGYNVFDTPRERLAKVVLSQYEKKQGKPLYVAEVRKSDPVENAPPPRSVKA